MPTWITGGSASITAVNPRHVETAAQKRVQRALTSTVGSGWTWAPATDELDKPVTRTHVLGDGPVRAGDQADNHIAVAWFGDEALNQLVGPSGAAAAIGRHDLGLAITRRPVGHRI